MVMELLAGETLAQRLARERTIPLSELARIMMRVGSAMACAHALGIVHRDLKPENIFLVESPSGFAVKVLDFGIAKLTASEGDAVRTGAITGTGSIVGTPYYMAPEQVFGEKDIDRRADIWALGIILYEALAGQRPTGGDNVGQIYKVIMTDAIMPLGKRAPQLPAPLVDLVGRMLSRDRSRRPSDMSEILSVLAGCADETFNPAALPAFPVLPDGPDPAAPRAQGVDDVPAIAAHDGSKPPNRSGIEVPQRSGTAGPRRRPWTGAVVAFAGAALVLGGLGAWSSRAQHATASGESVRSPPPTTLSLPAVVTTTSAAPTPSSSSASVPVPREGVGAPLASGTTEPAAKKPPPAVKRAPPVQASPSRSGVAAPTPIATPPPSAATAPAAVTVDPGSYQ